MPIGSGCLPVLVAVTCRSITEPVSQVIGGAVWWTLGLIGVTTILAFILGTLIGIVGAWRRGGVRDSIMPPIFVIMTVIPYFWLGLVLILFFGVDHHFLPYFDTYDITLTPAFTWTFISNVLEHAIMPAFTLLVTTIGTWILTMRNTMITTLAEDYVRMARAKGLPGWKIMMDYAARNAILPNLTGFAMSLGFVVGGAILIEEVFNYQGLGYLLLSAVNNDDYPLMQALFLLITGAVLVAICAPLLGGAKSAKKAAPIAGRLWWPDWRRPRPCWRRPLRPAGTTRWTRSPGPAELGPA